MTPRFPLASVLRARRAQEDAARAAALQARAMVLAAADRQAHRERALDERLAPERQAAGAYVAYYGWYEAQVLGGRSAPRPANWSESVLAWITAVGAPRVGLLLLAAIVLAVLVATGWRSSTAR